MSKKHVIHNGVKVSADWPAKVDAAQALTHYTIGGQKLARIRLGDDDPRWGEKPCLGCAVLKGQFHVPNCEYEKCPACGQIRAGGCSCDTEELREPDEEPTDDTLIKKRVSRLNVWCLVFVIICLLLLGRAVLMLFGI